MKTAESVLWGHPDKLCDLIADKILDEYLWHDPHSRVALEVQGGHGVINLTGEITSKYNLSWLSIRELVFNVLEDIGYDYKPQTQWNVSQQSPEIASGVERGGAGDSGITSGYATSETAEMLPSELVFARKLAQAFNGGGSLGPDGKIQVSQEEGKAKIIVASIQHAGELKGTKQRIEETIRFILGERIASDCRIIVNSAGSFHVGGFEADTGATGRKIVADQYGPRVVVGGGSFSGKDPTKVDRSGAYWAREVAKQIVQEGDPEAFVEFVWAIGEPRPVWGNVHPKYWLSVEEIIERLNLRKPNYYDRTKNHPT